MKLKTNLLVLLLCAIISTVLFYKHVFGLNLLIFQVLLFIWFLLTKQINLKSKNQIVVSISFLLTSIFTVVVHSKFSYFINFLAWFLLIGNLNFPNAKSLIHSMGIAFISLFKSQELFIKKIFKAKMGNLSLGNLIYKSRIFLIPLLIISLFIVLYSLSNSVFSDIVSKSLLSIENMFVYIFKDIDFFVVFTFLVCLLFSNFYLIRNSSQFIVEKDLKSSETLFRKKKIGKRYFGFLALKNEYKSAIFLFIILNLILLILNVIDINWVWINFEWQGESLKQFVHQGTYLLILSILISIALVLYYFRGNLNFYKKNSLLKKLSYVWIFQNGFLALSVGVRNLRYIEHYSLAFKRIGVIIFLIVTLYGLYTVAIKIKKRKSSFYLFKKNSFFVFIVLVLFSGINWDSCIAKYNFSHVDTSFLHLDYLATLSDKSLPHLEFNIEELNEMHELQKGKFTIDDYLMTPSEYKRRIENRKMNFKDAWESKHFLSWNYPEYIAYKKLLKTEEE